MILEEITIKNWRGYRSPHTFHFQKGINILVGRNEVGKSTIFEAMTRALFDHFDSKPEEIRLIQPLGSSLGPEVIVHFQADGQRYKAVKRFLQNPISELFIDRHGRWEQIHEGDKADEELRKILRGTVTTRTAARPEHRGLAQALWYLQTDGSFPEKEWNDGVKQGLQGLVQITARSPRERAILEKLDAAYSIYWTPTGRLTANSELTRLLDEIPTAEENLANLQEKARTVEGYRSDLEEFQELKTQKTVELQQATQELSELNELVIKADGFIHEKEMKERDLKEGGEVVQRLQQELVDLQDKQSKIADGNKAVKDLESTLTDIAINAKMELVESEHHARRWKEEIEPSLKNLDKELQSQLALVNLRKLNKDSERLEKHIFNIKQIRNHLDEMSEERATLLAPDVKESKNFAKTSEELHILDAKIETSAVKVAFEWDDREYEIIPKPHVGTTDDGEFIVTEPTEFHVQDVVRIKVRSGAQSLNDLISKKEELRQKLDGILVRYGVKDAEGLATLLEKARELDRTIKKLEERLKEASDAEPRAEDELLLVRRNIDEIIRTSDRPILNVSMGDEKSEKEHVAVLEKEKERLIKEIAYEQDLEKKSGQKHLDFIKNHEINSNSLAGRKAQIIIFSEGVEKILDSYGTPIHLKQLCIDSQEMVEKIKSSLNKIMENYEESVETPKRLYKQAEVRIVELEGQIQDLHIKIVRLMAKIEEASSQGYYGQLADAEIRLDQKKRRMETLKRRADGVKLLWNHVKMYEKDRSVALSGPIEGQMNKWLILLTEGHYNSLVIDDVLKPVGVHVAGYEADLPMASLSHGIQEQIVVLLRLSIGVLISKEEPNLIIIDDRLVNADSVRMKRLCLIFQEAAKTCQIIVATCNDSPYAGVGANIIRVPIDGVMIE